MHNECVANQQQHGDPTPCALVDLRSGVDAGYVVLKDLNGARQFLLIPTAHITGIESPAILAPGATNYFAQAWRARTFVEERAGGRLPREWVSLAVNSEQGRSQNLLHIHIDCVRADVHQALTRYGPQIGPAWTPFPVLLAGHRYDAIAVTGDNLDSVDPFTLLANGIAGARADMGRRTLVVVGTAANSEPGFLILAGRADNATGDSGSGEALQDHQSCPAPTPELRSK